MMAYFGITFADPSRAHEEQLLGGFITTASSFSTAVERAKQLAPDMIRKLRGLAPGSSVAVQCEEFEDCANFPDECLDRFLTIDEMFDAKQRAGYWPS